MTTNPSPSGQPAMYSSLMADMVAVRADPGVCIELAQRHGFGGIDLRLAGRIGWVERFGTDRLAEKMREAGLRAGYASMLTRTLSARPDEWEHAMEQLPRIAKAAEQLGYRRAGVVVMPFDDSLDFPANRKRHLDRLAQAAPVLADHGVSVGLEYVAPLTRRLDGTFHFVHNLAGLLELIEESGQPNVGVMLDCFHWHCARESTADIVALPVEKIVVVHVNDAPAGVPIDELDVRERELPGVSGEIDIQAFMNALQQVGYQGPVTAEPTHPRWPETTPDAAVRQTAEAVNNCVALAVAD